jgi:hypothetical protein
MNTKARFPRLALLSTLLFALITLFSLPTRHTQTGADGQYVYRLDLEVGGGYDVLAYDFAVVRDTLSHRLAQWVALLPEARYHWDAQGRQADSEAVLYSNLSLGFADELERQAMLQVLLKYEQVKLSLKSEGMTGWYGQISATLPIPGNPGAELEIKDWRFHMSVSRSTTPNAA